MTPLEVVGRAIAEANQEDFEETPNLHLALAEAALRSIRKLPPEIAEAHAVGFLRTWTDPWDCLGPQEEEALKLDSDGPETHDEAHTRIAEYMEIAWYDAIDTMLGKPVMSFSEIAALSDQPAA